MALKRQLYLLALLISLRLKDQALQREVILATPASEVNAMSSAPHSRFNCILTAGCSGGWLRCG